MAICQLKIGQAEEGIRGLGEFIATYPENVLARLTLAEYYQDLSQSQQVVTTLQPLVDRDAIDISLNYMMATAHARLGQQQQADAYFDTFQRLNRQLGVTQLLKKRYELMPSAELARQIAAALMESKWQDAGSWIIKSLSNDPGNAELHRMMVEFMRRSGRPAVAQQYQESAERLENATKRAADYPLPSAQ